MTAPIVDQVPANQSMPTPPRRRRGLALLTAGALVVLASALGISVALATRPTPTASPPVAERDQAGAVTSEATSTPAAEPTAKVEQPTDRASDRATGTDAARAPVLPDGPHDAYIRKLDAGRGTVVVDVVQVFTDRDGVEEAIKDGEPRDTAKFRTVYLRNQNSRLRTLPLADDVRVKLRECDEPPASRDVLLAKLARNARSGTYFYTLTVDNGVVQRIDEKIAGNAC